MISCKIIEILHFPDYNKSGEFATTVEAHAHPVSPSHYHLQFSHQRTNTLSSFDVVSNTAALRIIRSERGVYPLTYQSRCTPPAVVAGLPQRVGYCFPVIVTG